MHKNLFYFFNSSAFLFDIVFIKATHAHPIAPEHKHMKIHEHTNFFLKRFLADRQVQEVKSDQHDQQPGRDVKKLATFRRYLLDLCAKGAAYRADQQ